MSQKKKKSTPNPAPVKRKIILKPQAGPQEEFLSRDEDEILYGGAKGGGKSFGLLFGGLRHIDKEKYRAIIFRRTYPKLQHLIDLSKLYFSHPPLNGKYSSQTHRWTFPSGATFAFGSCKDQGSELTYQGHEYQYMGFDQLEEFTELQYLFLMAQNRTSDKSIPCRVRSTANPGGVGHLMCKKRFIDGKEPYKTYRKVYKLKNGQTITRTLAFIPATVYDNKILMEANPGYITNLLQLPPDVQKALLEGDWNIFAGQYFQEWRDRLHVSIPFKIPEGWIRFRMIDYGRTAPFCCLWGAVDYNKKVWIYREYYATGKNADENAKKVVILSGTEKYSFTIIDPSVFAKTGQEYTIGELLSENKLECEPGDNDRLGGWAILHQYLTNNKIAFFSNCVNCIRTIPGLIHDEKNVEDVDTNGEDHCLTGDTLITLAGNRSKKINNIKIGDIVKTKDGEHKVIRSWLTRKYVEIYEIKLSNGYKLKGTGGHKIYTERGKISIDALRYDDIIEVLNSKKILLWKKQSFLTIGDIIGTVDIIRQAGDVLKGEKDYIKLFGNITTGKRQEDSISIIKMEIERIINCLILDLLKLKNIYQTTLNLIGKNQSIERKEKKILRLLDHLQRNGIHLNKVSNGIKNTEKNYGEIGQQLKRIVKYVEKNIKLIFPQEQDFAISIVKRKHCGREDVYNLTVENEHNYYANGILVKNCGDALRYGLKALAGGKAIPPKLNPTPELEVEAIIKQQWDQQGEDEDASDEIEFK